ncbi:MAG: integrase [Oceanospirillaceae bacterium]|uniref:tyrosine-type recombinase/integrase n=1 Tax=unclassified Thalassolituus TaxID=2624967 RepID=UPI000C483215|nr:MULTISPECIES: integrase arm-type DNA-binding domain-containing protein [unclassified Thalassolituus]MAY00382.1 integrase [Oceanospirillaceae bacterium]MBL33992.1 integrase [Oceanospirillaceae bacterium]MBS51996.1 integrase [Oceanospirillaceae bacterium]|tara:strand:+ start:3714 stop:4949 length:1236 start_codon:yes stop_codon:yes gene_type:complete
MLKDTKIKALEAKEKDYKVSDTGGLFLLIKTTGAKYWRQKYRFMGKEKLLAIGTYPSVTLKQARKAQEEAKDLLKAGIDPSLYRKQQKARRELEADNSFSAIAREWHARQSNTWAPITARRNLDLIEKDLLPQLGKRPISELQTFELVGCLNRIIDRGAIETAHKARQIVNQVCRYAKQTGRLEHNPASDLAGAIPPKKVTHMAAITEPKAFGQLLVDIDSYKGSHILRTALALAPLLFQRPGELCGMEWSELDLEQGLWTIPREKKKERNQVEGDHIVPLSEQALALLIDLQPITGRSQMVFPNQRDHSRAIRTESLNKALRTLGYDTRTQQCAHGFRASARTMLDEQLNLRIEWIEHQLAHKVRDTLGNAYNRTKHLPERVQMMQRWADYLDNLKRQFLAGNVVTANFV